MNSSQLSRSRSEVESCHPQADDVLAVLLELGDQRREVAVAGDDDEGVDVVLRVGQVHRVDAQADVGRVLAGLPRRGISISSMAASCSAPVYLPNRLQSAYAFLTTILPFSTSRSRTLSMSKRSRRFWKPRARFSKSMKTASDRSPSPARCGFIPFLPVRCVVVRSRRLPLLCEIRLGLTMRRSIRAAIGRISGDTSGSVGRDELSP